MSQHMWAMQLIVVKVCRVVWLDLERERVDLWLVYCTQHLPRVDLGDMHVEVVWSGSRSILPTASKVIATVS